ncbi:hypothetical protein EVAR_96175_1 [Eumeta japonica]|uniref:Uncharacterized protein n=1 Tax=Eumeta variegata TaxID=151549 RepID=A0A4C1VJ02_EUMVA|nr:hypothetical protein EVAR_96175_1 [Eumeta japonica]
MKTQLFSITLLDVIQNKTGRILSQFIDFALKIDDKTLNEDMLLRPSKLSLLTFWSQLLGLSCSRLSPALTELLLKKSSPICSTNLELKYLRSKEDSSFPRNKTRMYYIFFPAFSYYPTERRATAVCQRSSRRENSMIVLMFPAGAGAASGPTHRAIPRGPRGPRGTHVDY